MNDTNTVRWIVTVLLSAICGAVIGWMSGCTPTQQASASQATVTGVRIAACVQSVLAEEERARLVERRLAQEAAELEAEAIKDAAREHPGSVKDEIEKVVRDGGTAK